VADLAGRPEEGPRFGELRRNLSPAHWNLNYRYTLRKREEVATALNSDVLPHCRDKWFLADEPPEYFEWYQTFCRLLWDSVYFQTYNFLDDVEVDKWFESDQPRPEHIGLLWHHNKSPPEIQATAELIQATCTDRTRNPIYDQIRTVQPDFSGLRDEEKSREYQIVEADLDNFGNCGRRIGPARIVYVLLSSGAGERRYGDSTFLPAIVCKQHAIASAKYENFPGIDELRQIIINRYYLRGNDLQGSPPVIDLDRHSWTGGTCPPLEFVPTDEEIRRLYD
jgi:hypothetical protein